jgi:hypothetical protein
VNLKGKDLFRVSYGGFSTIYQADFFWLEEGKISQGGGGWRAGLHAK